jgi:tetratricopeptide (TPR) repeat protein
MKDSGHLEAGQRRRRGSLFMGGLSPRELYLVLSLVTLSFILLASPRSFGTSSDPYLLGVQAFEQGRLTEALQLFQQAAHLHPHDARVANALGNTWLTLNQPSQARQEYLRAIALDTRLFAARKNLGILEYHQGHFPAAERQLAVVTQALPQDAVAWRFLGLSLEAGNRPQDAVVPLQKALTLESVNGQEETRWALARVFIETQKPDQAIVTLQAGLPDAKDKAGLYDLLGWLYQETHHSNEAAEAYRQAILADPKRPEAYLQLSWLYAQFRHFDAGIQTLREGMRFVPDPASLKLQLGTIMVMGGHEQESVPVLQDVIATEPHNPAGYTTLIINYTLLSPSYDQPLQIAEQALKECPGNYLIHYLYAGLLFRQHRQDLAQPDSAALVRRIRAELRESIRLNSDFQHSHYDLARLDFELSNYPAAEHEALAALRVDKDFSEARYLLGRVYKKEGRKQEGKEQIAQVEQQHIDDIHQVELEGEALLAKQAAATGSPVPVLSRTTGAEPGSAMK